MGKKKDTALRVVPDTNVLISSLLFNGELTRLVDLWKTGRIRPVFSGETFREFRTDLDYPKFQLSREEINSIIRDDVLPYFDVLEKIQGQTGSAGILRMINLSTWPRLHIHASSSLVIKIFYQLRVLSMC